MRISDWSSDVCSSDLAPASAASARSGTALVAAATLMKSLPGRGRAVTSVWQSASVRPLGCKSFLTLRVQHERAADRSEEHTSELQSLMRISYAVFCLKKKKHNTDQTQRNHAETARSLAQDRRYHV